jgi:hypothetical protein
MKGKELNAKNVDEIINKAKTFLNRVPKYSSNPEIQKRIVTITANMARTIGYKIAHDQAFRNLKNSPIKQEIKRQIISEMINQRVFERVSDKKEPLKVVENLLQGLINELTSLDWSTEKSKLFIEALCMIYETEEKGIKVF